VTPDRARFGLSRPVWLIGWVSFFTDTASEMVYPLLPLFLTRVLGAGALSLGVIEGIAEAANSVLKIVSGRVSDRTGHPKRLMLAGYALSSAVRPLIAVAGAWSHVLAIRFTDRLGKSSPRLSRSVRVRAGIGGLRRGGRPAYAADPSALRARAPAAAAGSARP
jgi:hypothetical protein